VASITQISSSQMPKGPKPISIPCPCDKTPQLTSLTWSNFCKVPEPKSHPGIPKGTVIFFFFSVWICFVNLNLLLLYHSDWFGFDGSWYGSLKWCSAWICLYGLCDNLVWDLKFLIWVRSGNWDWCLGFSLFFIYLISMRLHALILKLGFHYFSLLNCGS
jgi:hypothetical protein